MPSNTTKVISTISSLSTQFYRGFFHNRQELLASLLAQSLIEGNLDGIEEILRKNPELLLKRSQCKDKSNRDIHGTALQIALGMQDEGAAEIIINKFYLLDFVHAIQQFQEQFPKGIEKYYTISSYGFASLANALINGKDVDIWLDVFRHDFKRIVITKGLHFPLEYLIDALNTFVHFYTKLHQSGAADIYFISVIGYLQSLLPSSFAMVLCSGLTDYAHSSRNLIRTLTMEDGTPFYSEEEGTGLGFDFAVFGENGCKPYNEAHGFDAADIMLFIELLKEMNLRKKSELSHIASYLEEQITDDNLCQFL